MSRDRGVRAGTALMGAAAIHAIRHPLIILGAIASAGILVSGLWGRATVWQSLSVSVGGALLPLVGVSFLLAASIASREVRYGYGEHLDTLTHGRSTRNIGLLGGAVGPLAFGSILIVATLVVGALSVPAGVILWPEIMTGLLSIVIAWSAGMLFRGRVRVAAAAVLLGYAVLQLLGSPDVEVGASAGPGGIDWSRLLLWLPPSAFDSPFDALLRPSWLRFAFLASVLTLVLVALLVNTSRTMRLSAIGAAVILAVVLAAGVTAFRPSQSWALTTEPRPRVDWNVLNSEQGCLTTALATQCAYPGFESWFRVWGDVVASVNQVWPLFAPRIVQRPDNVAFSGREESPGPLQAVTHFEWDGRFGNTGTNAFALAVRLGETTVALPGSSVEHCDARGQGRGVLPFWLAALGTPDGRRILERLEGAPVVLNLGDTPLGGAIVGPETIDVAMALTERDAETVGSTLSERWNELTDPETDVADVAAWFGIEIRAVMAPAPEGRTPVCH